jgi:large subunit ribosomal protein L4
MVEVPVYRFATGEVATREVDDSTFGEGVRWRLLRDAVVMYQANRRVGTHSTKTRSEVNGAQRKPWRQKGTGRARAGTRKSPIWRGGGVVFGPKPRDYSYHLPKKALRQALRSAVLGKLLDGEVALVEGMQLEAPRTKEVAKAFQGLSVTGSALVVLSEEQDVLYRSARNIARTRVRRADDLNAHDVVVHERLIFTDEAFDKLVERLGHGRD